MKIFESKNNCCGCSACEQICPKNAVKMEPDNEGFLYPVIDSSLCVDYAVYDFRYCIHDCGYNLWQSVNK